MILETPFVKLIVGAALKDFALIENYAYIFTAAGADIIDISAFPLSVHSATKGIEKALAENPNFKKPFLMVSVNVDKDPHFRRIKVDADSCTECMQCIPACPADAFANQAGSFVYKEEYCYGCANCLDYCAFDAFSFDEWDSFDPLSLSALQQAGATAIEIHVSKNLAKLKGFYEKISPLGFLESFSIGSELMNAAELCQAAELIFDLTKTKREAGEQIIIQCDGIPLSGARELLGAAKDEVSIANAKLVKNFLETKLDTKNIFLQLAGGINEETYAKAIDFGLEIDGVAIGSYARKVLAEMDLVEARSWARWAVEQAVGRRHCEA